jgi:membrane-bound lytic murein transglycosylase D
MCENIKITIIVVVLAVSGVFHAAGISDGMNESGGYKEHGIGLLSSFYQFDAAKVKVYGDRSFFNDQGKYQGEHERLENGFVPFKSLEMKRDELEQLYATNGFNDAVKWRIEELFRHKHSVRRLLYRSGRYIETMADIFKEEGLPAGLVYLPFIESGFKTHARSHRSAVGLWQFMAATARKMGLKVDWWVDERRDPVKSSRAASQYLKYLYKRFGSWNLALAAYNGGEGRIKKALARAGTRDFWQLRNTSLIAKETKDYVPLYIASASVAIAPEYFGIGEITYDRPFVFDEVIIREPMSLEAIALFVDEDVALIRELNPELRRSGTPPNVAEYTLRVPAGKREVFLASLAGAHRVEEQYVKLYEVQYGDTVAKIARSIGASVEKLLDMNGLGSKAHIVAGEKILVPREGRWYPNNYGASYI